MLNQCEKYTDYTINEKYANFSLRFNVLPILVLEIHGMNNISKNSTKTSTD